MSRGAKHGQSTGMNNGNAKLTDEIVREIRRVRCPGLRVPKGDPNSLENLSKRFGVSKTQICWVINNKIWRNV
jgi:hypothetical protein